MSCWNFTKLSPCNNCPYRKDAPLQLWHRSEYIRLKEQENQQFGGVYGCHKKDGHVCVGWLMQQDRNNLPNINLRLVMIKQQVTREYLDALHCKVPMYDSVQEMIDANYPNENI